MPGGRSGSCVSVGLRFGGHVARVCYHPVRMGMRRRQAGHTFPTKVAGFHRTKPEAPVTDPMRQFAVRLRLLRILLASAPLLVRLRLSWLSFSRSGVWPDPRSGRLRCGLSPGSQLPTPAALNGLTSTVSPNPTDGICTRFERRHRVTTPTRKRVTDAALLCSREREQGLSASPNFIVLRLPRGGTSSVHSHDTACG